MSIERQKLKGDLQDAKRRFGELDLMAQDRLIDIRNILNPYEDDLTKLDVKKAKVFMEDLVKKTEEMTSLSDKIKKMEADLYG